MTKKDKEQMQQGIEKIALCLDAHWYQMSILDKNDLYRKGLSDTYSGIVQTLAVLGGKYLRDENGRHRVFLAGLSTEGNDSYCTGT